MEALVVKAEMGKINISYFSICLRTAYLFMDRIGLAGDMVMNMHFDEDFHDIPLLMKYKLIKDYKEEFDLPIDTINFDIVEKHLVKTAKLKHRPAIDYTLSKRTESAANNWLRVRTNSYNKEAKDSGLLFLKEIIEKDVFSLYKLDKKEESPSISHSIFIKPSELLQLQNSEHDIENTLFTLTDEFGDSDFLEDRIVWDYNCKEAMQTENIYLTKCFSFPCTIELSIGELKILRSILEQLTIPFNEAIDQWADMFMANKEASARIDFFSKNIIPLSPSIQKVIDENETLKYASKRDKDIVVEVWLGEAPLPIIWEYYNYYELISEASYLKLLKSLKENPDYNKRVPVMIISTMGEGRERIKIFEEQEEVEEIINTEVTDVLPVRKSILIND